ncbi:hypothetical protein Y032_0204g1893 [Ancylostoma ceylanicum]|uniref:Uncharacterized protein n=1 Tax=Ancylostoma ceylanicum TaxID=53326 RepID=A0A016SML1_9BILA|nr:hypothetical protein Y032_0204g1893 [Ancylostoma ceylanicum]
MRAKRSGRIIEFDVDYMCYSKDLVAQTLHHPRGDLLLLCGYRSSEDGLLCRLVPSLPLMDFFLLADTFYIDTENILRALSLNDQLHAGGHPFVFGTTLTFLLYSRNAAKVFHYVNYTLQVNLSAVIAGNDRNISASCSHNDRKGRKSLVIDRHSFLLFMLGFLAEIQNPSIAFRAVMSVSWSSCWNSTFIHCSSTHTNNMPNQSESSRSDGKKSKLSCKRKKAASDLQDQGCLALSNQNESIGSEAKQSKSLPEARTLPNYPLDRQCQNKSNQCEINRSDTSSRSESNRSDREKSRLSCKRKKAAKEPPDVRCRGGSEGFESEDEQSKPLPEGREENSNPLNNQCQDKPNQSEGSRSDRKKSRRLCKGKKAAREPPDARCRGGSDGIGSEDEQSKPLPERRNETSYPPDNQCQDKPGQSESSKSDRTKSKSPCKRKKAARDAPDHRGQGHARLNVFTFPQNPQWMPTLNSIPNTHNTERFVALWEAPRPTTAVRRSGKTKLFVLDLKLNVMRLMYSSLLKTDFVCLHPSGSLHTFIQTVSGMKMKTAQLDFHVHSLKGLCQQEIIRYSSRSTDIDSFSLYSTFS